MMHSIGDIIIRLIADGLVIPIVLLAAWMLLRLPRRVWLDRLTHGVFAGLVALWFAKILSILYQEGERPFMLLHQNAKAAYLNNPGFPSDHVLFVFMITMVVWVSTKNKPASIALLVMSLLVSLGRVLALVHTPLDVAGGIFCVLAAGLIVYGKQLFTAKLPD